SYPQQPQPPREPQRRQPAGLLRAVKSGVVVLAVFGAVGYWVWDYNTSPTGGKAKAEAAASAAADEAKKHEPEIGDCVKVKDPDGEPVPTVVDCDSAEAEYKLDEWMPGKYQECGSEYDYGIQFRNSGHRASYTMCFTKV
ncbi:LppU/SCO3897 family protein, partial [Streptomyces sp. NRRL S-481]|uniref:LppU/SCO3897 family protein n=1 Tax=Streptomyces sp. NRRL S-481 TaxID=1463911 RepID=UPI0007C5429F